MVSLIFLTSIDLARLCFGTRTPRRKHLTTWVASSWPRSCLCFLILLHFPKVTGIEKIQRYLVYPYVVSVIGMWSSKNIMGHTYIYAAPSEISTSYHQPIYKIRYFPSSPESKHSLSSARLHFLITCSPCRSS
jgi:hypothetical protein